MNETKTPDIQAMLEWLASCPLAASLNDGDVAFSIDYLGAEPCQFSLESTPTAPILEQYIRGSLRAKNYVLASRMSYTQNVVEQAANSSFGTTSPTGWRRRPPRRTCPSWQVIKRQRLWCAFPRGTS